MNRASSTRRRRGQERRIRRNVRGDAQSGCADWIPLLKERATDRPFFLWLASLDPHRPYHDGTLPMEPVPRK